MEAGQRPEIAGIGPREAGFLSHLARKYEHSESAGMARSYLIASVVILALFALARWMPWWGVALVLVEGIGLAMFRQYKRFARFKTGILVKLWRHATGTGEGAP